jgi:putative SOS response-associated peptidase YedK
MCGRYRIKDTDRITEHLRMTHNIPDWLIDQRKSRYNIAPSQDCPVIIMDDEGDVLPIPCFMRWGFVPFWDRSDKPKRAPINARSEEVATTGMFKQSLQMRRCLVPADGFYEWLRFDEKTKFPFDIHLRSNRPFVMAGIYEKATEIRPATFAILTTGPNELMSKIHDRMPVILDDNEAKAWLQRGNIMPERVAELTRPHPAEDMEMTPISSLVNLPNNDVPEILEPVAFTPPPKPAPKPIQGELF